MFDWPEAVPSEVVPRWLMRQGEEIPDLPLELVISGIQVEIKGRDPVG